MKKKITITLTHRRPVCITDNDWPVVARSDWSDHDNGLECQANRSWKAWLKVRQHKDGRTIVYGGYDYRTRWLGDSDKHYRGGIIVEPTPESLRTCDHRVIDAIREVGEDLGSRSGCTHFGDLISRCIADLPAEEM